MRRTATPNDTTSAEQPHHTRRFRRAIAALAVGAGLAVSAAAVVPTSDASAAVRKVKVCSTKKVWVKVRSRWVARYVTTCRWAPVAATTTTRPPTTAPTTTTVAGSKLVALAVTSTRVGPSVRFRVVFPNGAADTVTLPFVTQSVDAPIRAGNQVGLLHVDVAAVLGVGTVLTSAYLLT